MAADDMPPANLILQALHGIRSDQRDVKDEVKQTNARLDTLTERLDETNARLSRVEVGLDRLNHHTNKSLLETNTKLAALTQTVADMGDKVVQHDKRLDHLLTAGLGAEVRDLRVRGTRLESGRTVRKKPPKKRD